MNLRPRRPARRLAAPAFIGSVAVALLTGCGGASAPNVTLPGTAAPGTAAPRAEGVLSAGKAIGLAARQARRVNSYALSLHTRSTGIATENTSGTMQIRLKPSLLGEVRLNLSLGGHALPVEEIVTGHALYLKLAALGSATGKPWIKISDAGMRHGSGATISQLLQGIENANPLAQTTMLTASKNRHKVGTQVINGVQPTHYTGSYPISRAFAKVPASLRSMTGPILRSMGIKTVHFNAWIDGQHQVRKIITTEAGATTRITTTIVITAINQPVSVQLPPASQVATAPSSLGGGLGGLG